MKARYAIQALVHMASHGPEGSFVARKIAQEEEIPQKFLEEILLDLRKGRILRSKAGKCGGYSFRIEPAQVTLQDAFHAINDPLASRRDYAEQPEWSRLSDIDYLLEPIQRRLHIARRDVLSEVTIARLAEQLKEREKNELVPDFQI